MLIPASDCAFHSLTLPAGLRKPPLQVAPFLLEEQLADDVEATHFALLHRQQAQCEIVAVQRQKMRDWLARCESLSLQPSALTPDVLALPSQPPAWSAVQVDEQWLIRHQPWGGMAAENVWLTELLQSEAEEHVIDSYSPPPAAPGVWREQPAQTLLTLAARHPAAQKLSLLQGKFAARRRSAQASWRPARYAALALALLAGANSVLDHRDLARQAEAAQQASRAFYHRWFPTEKKVINPRLQMQQHLQTLTRQAQHAPRRPPQRLAKHPQRNAGDPSASAELGCRGQSSAAGYRRGLFPGAGAVYPAGAAAVSRPAGRHDHETGWH